MAELKEIIRVLGFIQEYFDNHADEQETDKRKELFKDWSDTVLETIALLKAQEPVIVKCTTKRTLVDDTYEVVYQDETFYDCPACGQRLSRWNKDTQIKYCWTCGQAVKWNGR